MVNLASVSARLWMHFISHNVVPTVYVVNDAGVNEACVFTRSSPSVRWQYRHGSQVFGIFFWLQ